MEGIRNQLNKLDKDQTDYEEKHDNRCFSMLNVIKKVLLCVYNKKIEQWIEKRFGCRREKNTKYEKNV